MAGIPVAKSVHLFKNQPVDPTHILSTLTLPVFVKPNNGGSSIGMSKVDNPDELQVAIDKAFHEDDQVLVEQMIQGPEFTVGVYKGQNAITVLPITAIEAHKEQSFFDFEAKYQGKSTETTPANIPNEWKANLEATAEKIYRVFNCNGVVRIDFIYHVEENRPYMLEINTIPGQSDASVIPQQVRAAGGNLQDFYSEILETALNNKVSSSQVS
jgi:D-alanine-D-alanine ligase